MKTGEMAGHFDRKTRDAVTKEYPVFCAVGRMRATGSNLEQATR
jgi:hypothetical protein